MIAESARWLFRRGNKDSALASLLRTRSRAEAEVEMREMEETAAATHQKSQAAKAAGGDSLLRRKYVLPFVIACIILACNQATGVNSILAYIVNILNQAGLPGSVANLGDVSIKVLNCLMTVVAVILVDRAGRKFLLAIGSAGIVVCLGLGGLLFLAAERGRTDDASVFRDVQSTVAAPDYQYSVGTSYLTGTHGLKENKVKALAWLSAWLAKAPAGEGASAVKARLDAIRAGFKPDDAKAAEDLGKELDQALVVLFDEHLLAKAVGKDIASFPRTADEKPMAQISFVWSYGPFTGVQSRRCDAIDNQAIEVYRSETVQGDNVLEAFFRKLHVNPFSDPAAGRAAPLEIKKAMIGPVPGVGHGWLVAICLFGFMAFFAVGPGVCVWLALSELMPTRIRSNGMSIALLLNQFVSATIAAVFLPTVGNYGYAAMFFFWSGCTVVYFLTAVFLLPETKGKTLEEIEEHFSGHEQGHFPAR